MLQFFHRNIQLFYFGSLAIVICGLSTSMFLMSLGTITVSAVWLLEGNFKNKWQSAKTNTVLLLLAGVYLLHALALLYSHNLDYGINDLRIKLPLLVFPVVLATGIRLEKKYIDWLIWIFIASVFLSTVYSFLIYKNIISIDRDMSDARTISRLISHIRLSLNICMSIFLLFFYFKDLTGKNYFWKIIGAIWFIWFLYIMESATGFSILAISFLVICGYLAVTAEKTVYRTASVGILVLMIMIVGIFIYTVITQYYQPRDLDISHLEEKTPYGERYEHDTTNLQLENGYYLWLYIAQNELEAAWNEKSEFEYQGLDKKDQPIKWTIIRYMTSKGLRKDKDGVKQLTKEDVANIENGIASTEFLHSSGLKRRIKVILYEIDSYLRGITPNGNSVTQRFEYWRIGWNLFKANLLIGVGTGDVDDEYRKQYRTDKSSLMLKFRHRAHNQYLTFLITFGVIGFLIFMISLIWPLIVYRHEITLLYLLFFTIIAFSFIGEDTLETQAGVTFYSFFNALFLFQLLKNNQQITKK